MADRRGTVVLIVCLLLMLLGAVFAAGHAELWMLQAVEAQAQAAADASALAGASTLLPGASSDSLWPRAEALARLNRARLIEVRVVDHQVRVTVSEPARLGRTITAKARAGVSGTPPHVVLTR